jgi:hypothetical protein
MLTNIISNPMEVSISNGVPRKTPNFIHGTKAPHEFVGASKVMYVTLFFSIETLAMLSMQSTTMLHLVATLCKNGGTSNVVFKSKDIFIPNIIPT